MRTWTKAAGILLAAVASVTAIQIIKAQDAAPNAAATDAVKSGEGDAFATPAAKGRNLATPQVKTTGGMIDFYSVTEQPVGDFLQQIAQMLDKNIVPSKEVRGTISASFAKVTPMELLDAVLQANGFAYREKGNFIYVYSKKELEQIEKSEMKTVTQVFRLNYVPADIARDMIKPALSADGQTAVYKDKEWQISTEAKSVEFSSYSAEDMIIVTDYPEVMEKIKMIVKELDKRPQQILVESTILQAKLQDDNALGVDFTILGGVDFQSVTGTGSTVNQTLNGAIVDNPKAGGVVDNGFNSVGTRLKDPTSTSGLNVGIVSNNVAMFINALESITDTVVLANPKVLTLNKQPGVVIVGRKSGYYTTTVTQTSTVQSVEYLETGTRLIFKPFVADDGYIRMIIHPEDSTGGLNSAQLPFKDTTEVTTNVLVKDGHTIVIGGLFREDNSVNKSQVPFLGDIPLAGYLFRSQKDSISRDEVIVLLTPHIIKSEPEYAAGGEAMLKRANQLLIGSRREMMPFSTARMAEMCYDKARTELSAKYPDRDKAMWYLDCATCLQPVFPEATDMKEAVSSQEVMAAEQNGMRYFLRRQIMLEEAAKTPVTTADNAPAKVEPAPAPAPAPVVKPEVVPAPKPEAVPAKVDVPAPAKVEAAPAAEPAVKELPAAGSVDDSNK